MIQQQPNDCQQLGIACVPIQAWAQTYRPEDAFINGTIFPELNLPFNAKINIFSSLKITKIFINMLHFHVHGLPSVTFPASRGIPRSALQLKS